MKIGLNQPNGFPTMFGPDSSKYTDISNPSTSHFTQISSIVNAVVSIHTHSTMVQSSLLLEVISLLQEAIPDSLKDIVSLQDKNRNQSNQLIRQFWQLQECMPIFVNFKKSLKQSSKFMITKLKGKQQPRVSLIY